MSKWTYLSVPQAEVHAERTEASTSQQSLPSPPVLPDIPVVTGVEESEAAGAQDDKEELEFPHDLLPSLDFSSELNIWESSLGYVEKCYSDTCSCISNIMCILLSYQVYLIELLTPV